MVNPAQYAVPTPVLCRLTVTLAPALPSPSPSPTAINGFSSGIKGSISFPHFMAHKTAAVDYAIFSVAFLLLFLINRVNFSLGGSLSCLLVAIYNAILAIVSKVEMMHHSRESAATIPATNNCESVL